MSKTFELKRTVSHSGIDLWRIDVGRLPALEADRPAIAALMLSLMHGLAVRGQLNQTVWLEATHIHEEGTTTLISPNARAWVPRTGFGVHPRGPYPRMWTNEDFSGAPFGHKIPIFNNQVFEISRSTGHASAIQSMAGRAVLMILLLNGPVDAFKSVMNATLGPMVKEEAFHAYGYFFPLLTADDAGEAALGTWMGNASVYIRESAEDKAILLYSRIPLEESLHTMGAVKRAEGVWHLEPRETQ